MLLPDPDHVEVLRRGPKAWNAWREKAEPLVPKLTGIALKFGEQQMGPISGGPINLAYAELSGAFLRFATLTRANLEAADLSDADLANARLDHANLSYANLRNARLEHADLAGAKLMKADLSGANLRTARNLTERQLNGAVGSAATILPPHLPRPARWEEATSHTGDLSPLDTFRERGSTRTKLSWTAMLLVGGAIAVVVVLLTVNLSIEQGASFESTSRRSEKPLSPPEDRATAEPKLVAERPERPKDKPAAPFTRSAPEPD